MKLLLKLNLALLLVFNLGLAAIAQLSWSVLERNARDETAQDARLLMDAALAARSYTSAEIAPLLETQAQYAFVPQSVPAYAAAKLLGELHKKHVDFSYREAVLNPTNPRNRAAQWEAQIVEQFRGDNDSIELIGDHDAPSGRALHIARPIRITDAKCLGCHGAAEAAPRTLVERYGRHNGFGWSMNEVVGAQIVSVPAHVPGTRAGQAFRVFMPSVTVVFVAVGVLLNIVVWAMCVRPLARLSRYAARVSLGELDVPEFRATSGDEIGVLAESFGRLRTSLRQAMTMLDGNP